MSNAIFDVDLHLLSQSDKDRQGQEVSKAFSTVSGLIGYTNWTPQTINLTTLQDRFDYAVAGRLEWKLLNCTVYIEQKIYTGSVKKNLAKQLRSGLHAIHVCVKRSMQAK